MKKHLSFLSFIILLAGIIFISCSKETPGTNSNKQDGNVVTNSTVDNNPGRIKPRNAGSISGVLNPVPLKASITAYNDHYVSEEAIMNSDGSFKIDYLPPDGYNLLINYVPVNSSDYKTFEVYKITVIANQETKLGYIDLPE